MSGDSRASKPAPTRTLPSVDVIVATRNRPADLTRLVTALASQTVCDFGVYIVDQSDDPEPGRRTVSELGRDRFVHMQQGGTGKSRALNLALVHTTADIIAFTDDDCVPPSDWVETVRAVLADGALELCFGRVIAHDRHDPQTEFMPAVDFDDRVELPNRWLRSRPSFGMGANMCIQRSRLVASGGFDERFGPGAGLRAAEDVDIAYRVQYAGGRVGRDPRLWVVHHGGRRIGSVSSHHVADAYYGIGGVYGTKVRLGDWRALVMALDEARQTVLLVGRAVLRSERPVHLRRLLAFASGFVIGLKSRSRPRE